MKLIQMQYSPDAFDSFIKQKLDEVEVDSSMADDYWSKMNNDCFEKKGISVGKKFIYLSICLVVLSSIFYFTYNQFSEAPIKENAIKQTPAVIENEGVLDHKPSDAQSPNKSPIELRRTQNNTAKVKLNQIDESKAMTNAIDNTKTTNNALKQEDIPSKEITVSNHNKTSMQAPTVILKDSVRAIESNPVIQKKKKGAVSIIW